MEFKDLPPEIIGEIVGHGDPRDAAMLAAASKQTYQSVQEILQSMKQYKLGLFNLIIAILQQISKVGGDLAQFIIDETRLFTIDIETVINPLNIHTLINHLLDTNYLQGTIWIHRNISSNVFQWLGEFARFIHPITGEPVETIPDNTTLNIMDSEHDHPYNANTSYPEFVYRINFNTPSEFFETMSLLLPDELEIIHPDDDLNDNTFLSRVVQTNREIENDPVIQGLFPRVERYILIHPNVKF